MCILLLSICVAAQAQPFALSADLRFENFNASNKFATEFINGLATDNKGYIWVGANGVNRFDGNRFVQYHRFDKPENGLKNSYVQAIVEDEEGRVWAGTGSELCYYDKDTDKFIDLNISDSQKIFYAYQLKLTKGKLWFLCNYGLCYVDLIELKVHTTSLNKVLSSILLFDIDDNTLLISGFEGVFIYRINENKWDNLVVPVGISVYAAARMANSIWIGTNAGIWQMDKGYRFIHRLKATKQYDVNTMIAIPALTGDFCIMDRNGNRWTDNI